MVHVIQRRLYSNFYCTGVTVPLDQEPPEPSPASVRAAFVSELMLANSGGGYLEQDWEVTGQEGTHLLIRRNGLTLKIAKGEFVSPVASPITPGTNVARRMPKELLFVSPSFFTAMGDEVLSGESGALIRCYWNLKPEGAARLVEAVATRFNRARLPFRLKVLDDPARFTRCDAGVLYAARRDYPGIAKLLAATHAGLEPYLKSETPALTKPFAAGLGLAEDPAHGASFGDHRCRVLAEGLVRAFELPRTTAAKRSRVVQECFAEQGISLETPFLNPGSADVFDLPQRRGRYGARQAAAAPHDLPLDRDLLLQTAVEIGEIVASTAVWYRDRCNWLAMGLPRDDRLDNGASRLVYRPLGPDIYAGTSGVSLFLAELSASTGDPTARRTSIGAIRQALSTEGGDSKSAHFGLYDGALGIAVVSAYVGKLLREEDLLDAAALIARRALSDTREYECADLLTGNAGAIVALLILRELLEDADLTGFAVELGGELLQAAERRNGHSSWKSATFPKQRNLLGLSHGTAGIGYALLELYRATRDSSYRELAESAFAYERSCYVEEAKGWPDFRGVHVRPRRKDYPVPLPVFWCHGAAGIALSRLHAHAILDDESYRSEALEGLTTTQLWTERMLAEGSAGFSLCHGLAGNAEVLATGSRLLADAFPEGWDIAAKVATVGIRRYTEGQGQWPFDGLGAGSPSLMLGLSGVGHFYLRLYDPEVAPLLLPDRDAMLRRSDHGR